jgi:hypothetical protein
MAEQNQNFIGEPYLLFLFQEAGFQTRSLLVPQKPFLEIPQRKQDYEYLKEYAFKNVILPLENDTSNTVNVQYLLVQNYQKDDPTTELGVYSQELHPYTKSVNHLKFYSDWGRDEDALLDINDKEWEKDSYCDFVGGFHHLKNYKEWQKMTSIHDKPINIVESFLILESKNGKINCSIYGTVDEMFEGLYGVKLSTIKEHFHN